MADSSDVPVSSRLRADPVRTRYRAAFKRQRALQALQLLALDSEVAAADAARAVVQRLAEARARAVDRRQRGFAGSGLTDNLPLIEKRLEEARVACARLDLLLESRNDRIAAVAEKHRREKARAVFLAGVEWKRLGVKPVPGAPAGAAAVVSGTSAGDDTAAAGAGEAAEDDAPAASAAAAGPAAATTTAASFKSTATAAAALYTQVCAYCAAAMDKARVVTCSECHRDFCGVGGRSMKVPHGLPCLELHQCNCGTLLCIECYDARLTRAPVFWGHCALCSSLMCPREVEGRGAECKSCAVAPVCKGCRADHERACMLQGLARSSRNAAAGSGPWSAVSAGVASGSGGYGAAAASAYPAYR